MSCGKVKKWWENEFDTNNIYYVYEWFDIDNNYVFYVGKGSGNRYKDKAPSKRNRYFVYYIKAHNCDVKIIKDKMNEKDAFDFEKQTIEELRKSGQCCCNFDDGGGKCSPHLKGELNPMYGKTHSKEAIEKIRAANLNGKNSGKNNSQYGISPSDRMNEETYRAWIEKHKAAFIGSKNNKARKTIMRNIDGTIYKEFECIKECAMFLADFFPELSARKIENLRRFPEVHNSPQKAYKNFYFEIIKPNKDNTVSSVGYNSDEDVTTNESISDKKNIGEEASSVADI